MHATSERKSVKLNPTPTRRTRVVFDAGDLRPVRSFGRGILAFAPAGRLDCSIEDLRWSEVQMNTADEPSDEYYDAMAFASECDDRYARMCEESPYAVADPRSMTRVMLAMHWLKHHENQTGEGATPAAVAAAEAFARECQP
jgi:hypothetical protein